MALEDYSEVLDLKRLFDATPSGLRRGVSQVPSGGFARYLTAEVNKSKAEHVRKEHAEREKQCRWKTGAPLQRSEWEDGARGALGNGSGWKPPMDWNDARSKSASNLHGNVSMHMSRSLMPCAADAVSPDRDPTRISPYYPNTTTPAPEKKGTPRTEDRATRAMAISSRSPVSGLQLLQFSPAAESSPTSVCFEAKDTWQFEVKEYDETVFPYMLQANSAYNAMVHESNAQAAQDTREEIARWREEGRREEQKRRARDAAKRTEVLAARINSLMAKEDMLRARQVEAEEVMRESCRLHDLAVKDRENFKQYQNARASKSFDRRYMNTEECVATLERFDTAAASLTPRGYYTMESPEVVGQSYLKPTKGLHKSKGLCDRVKSENDALYRKIHHVAARTDDDVGDETAGKARATMAAKSRARKKKEAAKLAKENEEYKKTMESIKSKVDCAYDETPMS